MSALFGRASDIKIAYKEMVSEIERSPEPLRDKLHALSTISSVEIDFDIDVLCGKIDLAAERQTLVAAAVMSPYIPVESAVYIGRLNPVQPVVLTKRGIVANTGLGVIARMHMGHDNGERAMSQNSTWGLSSRISPDADTRDPLPTPPTDMSVHLNPLPYNYDGIEGKKGSLTFPADRRVTRLLGLDHRFAFEDVDLPDPVVLEMTEQDDRSGLQLIKSMGIELYTQVYEQAKAMTEAPDMSSEGNRTHYWTLG